MEEKVLEVLQEIKKELQDIRSILEPKNVDVKLTFKGSCSNDIEKLFEGESNHP